MDGFVSGAIMLFIVLCLGIVLVVLSTINGHDAAAMIVRVFGCVLSVAAAVFLLGLRPGETTSESQVTGSSPIRQFSASDTTDTSSTSTVSGWVTGWVFFHYADAGVSTSSTTRNGKQYEVFVRQEDGSWLMQTYDATETSLVEDDSQTPCVETITTTEMYTGTTFFGIVLSDKGPIQTESGTSTRTEIVVPTGTIATIGQN